MKNKCWRAWTVPFLCACLAGCMGDPPGLGDSSGGGQHAYHPDNDLLINPPEMFEVYPDDELERVDQDATLTRLLIGEPRTLNPIFANSWFDYYLSSLLFSSLMYRNHDMEFYPNRLLIEDFQESDDRRVTSIRLRPDLKWHDGEPFTAHDVRFTWEMITKNEVPAANYKVRVGRIADVVIQDDLNFQIIHGDVSTIYHLSMAFPILPKHIYGKPEELAKDPSLWQSDYYNHYNREKIVGNGPYKLVDWITNDRLVVERWDDYPFGGAAHVCRNGPVELEGVFTRLHPEKNLTLHKDPTCTEPNRVRGLVKRQILKVSSDRNIALLLFKKGELDEIWLTPQQFATQCNDEAFKELGVKGYGMRRMFALIAWNEDGSNPFFTDKRVRWAMAHAYDCERVLRDVTYNLYTPSRGMFDPAHYAFNDDVERILFDLDKAAALLDEAGWEVSPEDGWRYKTIDGVPVRFEFELLIAQSFADAVKMTNIYREDLNKIGISFSTRIIENAAFDEKSLKHEFQAQVSVEEVSSDPHFWRNKFHSESHLLGRNFTKYANDRVDELFDDTRIEFDRTKRTAQFREIHALVYEDQPYLFLWDYSMLHGFSKRLRGVSFSPAGAFLFRYGEGGWWVLKDPAA